MHNFWKIISKPDNVPIMGMLLFGIFFFVYSLAQAWRNDLRAKRGEDSIEKVHADKGKVHVWPYLIRLEMLCVILISIILIIWSVLLDAPLEERANPSVTPNPAKAPWYFLGLQEMLVYFDPWIAGVVLPSLIVVGLMVIPYVDITRHGTGRYSFNVRKLAIMIFCFGFAMWIALIIIGTFMRGPGWIWFWPWETWDPKIVVEQTSIDLSDKFFGVVSTGTVGFFIGFLVISGYYALTMWGSHVLLRKRDKDFPKQLGLTRFLIIGFLFWTMMALPIKMFLLLALNVKYVWVTPWFNI